MIQFNFKLLDKCDADKDVFISIDELACIEAEKKLGFIIAAAIKVPGGGGFIEIPENEDRKVSREEARDRFIEDRSMRQGYGSQWWLFMYKLESYFAMKVETYILFFSYKFSIMLK